MITVITGGSGSGKSEYGEETAVLLASEKEGRSLIYIATMIPFDKECEKKIERHQRLRAGKGFRTIECYMNLKQLKLPEHAVVLLECMSNLLANEIYQKEGSGKNCLEEIKAGIQNLEKQADHVIVITNEINSAGRNEEKEMEFYMKQLGAMNSWMAEQAEQVTEVVYSIPVKIEMPHKRIKIELQR